MRCEHRHYHQSPVAQIIRPAISNQKMLIVWKWRFVPWDIWTPGPWSRTLRWGEWRGYPWPPRRRRRRTPPSLTSRRGCGWLGPWDGGCGWPLLPGGWQGLTDWAFTVAPSLSILYTALRYRRVRVRGSLKSISHWTFNKELLSSVWLSNPTCDVDRK